MRAENSISAGMAALHLGVMASHGGSNLQALIDAIEAGRLSATIRLVVSNNPNAYALERARQAGIPTAVINAKSHPDEDARDLAIRDALCDQGVHWIQLAGYMKKLGPRTIEAFPGRILNIHPGPLPRFGGKGMYGLHVHEAVLAAGVPYSGPTLHWVDGSYDTGPIVAHAPVPVLSEDTPETLAARVLEREHSLLVETWQQIAENSPTGEGDSIWGR